MQEMSVRGGAVTVRQLLHKDEVQKVRHPFWYSMCQFARRLRYKLNTNFRCELLLFLVQRIDHLVKETQRSLTTCFQSSL